MIRTETATITASSTRLKERRSRVGMGNAYLIFVRRGLEYTTFAIIYRLNESPPSSQQEQVEVSDVCTKTKLGSLCSSSRPGRSSAYPSPAMTASRITNVTIAVAILICEKSSEG